MSNVVVIMLLTYIIAKFIDYFHNCFKYNYDKYCRNNNLRIWFMNF